MARAMMNGPELILADEPTGNLDPDSAAIVLGLLAQFHQDGGTVLLVTHDPGEAARMGHRVVVMDHQGLFEPHKFESAPVRAPGDSETLKAQTQLLAAVRESVDRGAATRR